jgi:transporter family-2 protein
MTAVLALIAAIAGSGQAPQSAMNAKLREGVHSGTLAACLSFLLGALLLGMLAVRGVLGKGELRAPSRVPLWAWFGGAIGAAQVVANLVVVPRVSAGLGLGAALVGQLIAALVMDHFGWFGLQRVPINSWRIVGAVFLLAGIFLVQKR